MEAQAHSAEHGHARGGIRSLLFSTDHKVIGIQYLVTGLLMAIVGGFMAYAFRYNLAYPGENIPLFGSMSAAEYNAMITYHAAIMVFWVGMPCLLAAFGNLLIPLMIGCDDMVFPRLNRLSYQIFLLSVIVLIISLLVPGGGFSGAWTLYPPLSTKMGPMGSADWGGQLFILAVALEFAAFLMGGINFLTTTLNARTKGMSLWELPIFIWMVNLASILFMLSVGPLIAGAVMLLVDRTFGTGFFDPASGGDPLLFQHLFWFFGHPEVYVLFLPGLGIVGEIITCHSRKTLFGYKMIVLATIITGLLSFIVWAHHQFIAGIDPRMANFFSISTIMISLPVAVVLFSYLATLYGGSITYNTPMLFALGFLATFLLGGVTGIHLGTTSSDIYFHDNYFVVAHFHYTMFPTVILALMAGIYHWYPKFTGRKMNELLGQIHFWGTFLPFNAIFIPLFFSGFAGQHRRIANYAAFPELSELGDIRRFATTATIVMLLFQIPFVINFFLSTRTGKKAGDNPWNATTLEWACPSPPPHGNFDGEVTVYHGPYEYSVPGAKEDFIPQNQAG